MGCHVIHYWIPLCLWINFVLVWIYFLCMNICDRKIFVTEMKFINFLNEVHICVYFINSNILSCKIWNWHKMRFSTSFLYFLNAISVLVFNCITILLFHWFKKDDGDFCTCISVISGCGSLADFELWNII